MLFGTPIPCRLFADAFIMPAAAVAGQYLRGVGFALVVTQRGLPLGVRNCREFRLAPHSRAAVQSKRQQFASETRLYLPLSASNIAGVGYKVLSTSSHVKGLFMMPLRRARTAHGRRMRPG